MSLCNFAREALIYKGHYTCIGEWNAPKCLCACAHVNFEFLEMYFEFQRRSQKFKFSMSRLIFSVPPSWPHVWLDNLNSRSLGLSCGVRHAAPVGSGFNVSFSYIWTHTWWPVWRQACNLPKPTEGHRVRLQSGPYHFGHPLFFAHISWVFSLFLPVYVALVVFILMQPQVQISSLAFFLVSQHMPKFALCFQFL